MHIAICDDNIADRKQTERLMEREADKWIAIGKPIYNFSFGSVGSLLASNTEYDAIILDIQHTEGENNVSVIRKLRENGNNSPVIITSSKTEWESMDFPEDTLFLEKAIKVSELHEMMVTIDGYRESKIPRIELRGENETWYVTEEEIVYAEQAGRFTEITMSDGRILKVHGNAFNLFDNIEAAHHIFAMPSRNSIINIRYVKSMSPLGRVKMSDNKTFMVTGAVKNYVKRLMDELK